MKKNVWFLGTSLVLVLLTACQNAESETQVESGGHEHEHNHEHSEVVQTTTIEGLNDHYHSGDQAELSVSMNEEENGHWHWYQKSDGEDWTLIEDEFENSISIEAVDGLEVKATFYNENHEVLVESEPVQIHIDDHNNDVYKGYFEDEDIADRELSDWAGEWQSVYPYLTSGELDEVFEHKAKDGDMTEVEYKDYYQTGYETDVNDIMIKEDGEITFKSEEQTITGQYEYDGYEILEYEAGNRGVRFIFKKIDGDNSAPKYVQFSDHIIAPEKSGHYHLYWGDDREELLSEVDHWPTYYPKNQTIDDIKNDMLQH
ncbi:metal-binding protein ZinT [Jeotgalicoccus huakuii]|nr:metal-binding protein ZinT [Jeotgalicoccus huakuii]